MCLLWARQLYLLLLQLERLWSLNHKEEQTSILAFYHVYKKAYFWDALEQATSSEHFCKIDPRMVDSSSLLLPQLHLCLSLHVILTLA